MRFLSVDFMAGALAGAALLMNNPAGHSLLQEAGLRIAFHDAHMYARERLGLPEMTFGEFRDFAPMALTDFYPTMEEYKEAVSALTGGSVPFCLPLSSDEDDPSRSPFDQPQACHAVCGRKEGLLDETDDGGDDDLDDALPPPIPV